MKYSYNSYLVTCRLSIDKLNFEDEMIQGNDYNLYLQYDGPLNLAYDVGCGSGQSTQFLAPYFTQVIGTDVSSAQIDNAIKGNPQPNIKFE